jgi:hypothetical protein
MTVSADNIIINAQPIIDAIIASSAASSSSSSAAEPAPKKPALGVVDGKNSTAATVDDIDWRTMYRTIIGDISYRNTARILNVIHQVCDMSCAFSFLFVFPLVIIFLSANRLIHYCNKHPLLLLQQPSDEIIIHHHASSPIIIYSRELNRGRCLFPSTLLLSLYYLFLLMMMI